MNDFNFYFGLGWEHIVSTEALDHLLFLAALAVVFTLRDWKQALLLATAFTIGHTVALVAATKGWISVDEAVVEFLVACTLIITAVANLFQRTFEASSARRTYFFALFFGLVHGLAFATVLQMILAREQSLGAAVAAFATGLETGQLLVVLLVLATGQLLLTKLKIDRQHWVIFVSAAVFALSLEMAAQRWPWGRNRERNAVSLPVLRPIASNLPPASLKQT